MNGYMLDCSSWGIFVLDLKSNKGHTLHNIVGDPTSLPA